MSTYRCFGFPVASTLEFPGAWRDGEDDETATVLVDGAADAAGFSDEPGWEGICDGERFVVTHDGAGTHRFRHGGRLLFELSADHRRLSGDLRPQTRSLHWWRSLLDSVLYTVGLLRGREALHAGAVATAAGTVAIAGPSGAGKSTLLAHLVEQRGLELVTDDILFLESSAGGVLAHPGPPVMTVPTARVPTGATVLGQLDDEAWVARPVPAVAAPLVRLVVLDRRGGPRAEVEPEPAPFPTLMGHLLPYPRSTDRQAARLELAADLASTVQIVHLSAELTCPVAEVAEAALGDLSAA